MTSRMTETQAQALAALIVRLRAADGMPEWDNAGIIAKLREAAPTASSWDLARAALNLAENRDLRTPGVLPQPGPHWSKPDGSKPPRRGDHTMRCPEHGERLSCTPCNADVRPPSPDELAAMRAETEKAKTTHHQRDAEKAAREEAKRDG